MRTLELNKLVVILSFLSMITACNKTIIEQVCKKRFITAVRILQVENSGSLDLLDGPDLRLDMGPEASQNWSYSTNTADDVEAYPISISFPNPILMSEENWEFQLVDEDPLSEDLVCKDSFHPYEEGEDGVIVLRKNGQEILEFIYTEEE